MDIPKASVYSVYFKNINPIVLEYQKKCVEFFLPKDWTFKQVLFSDKETFEDGKLVYPHAAALSACVKDNQEDITIFLDIDCIPVNKLAFAMLATGAKEKILVGAIQRANHIQNEDHLYVGPFCMAFSKKHYIDLGSPTFNATDRGDIGEELTYRWHEKEQTVAYFWPSQVEKPLWTLFNDVQFGIGTTYDNLFYHFFCIRNEEMQKTFVDRCKMFMERFDEELHDETDELIKA